MVNVPDNPKREVPLFPPSRAYRESDVSNWRVGSGTGVLRLSLASIMELQR